MLIDPLVSWEEEFAFIEQHRSRLGGLVLYGSSTIRLWSDPSRDLGVPATNCGFGGSTLRECALAFDRLVRPLCPDILVVYAGDNDLDQGRTPEQVLASWIELLGKIRAYRRDLPVCLVSIKPSPSRWRLADVLRRTNRLLSEECSRQDHAWFLDLVPCFLDGDLRPRQRLFEEDLLHLSGAGYEVFSAGLRHWLGRIGTARGPSPVSTPMREGVASPLLPRTLRMHPARQPTTEVRREYHQWHSRSLGRTMELLRFGHAGQRLVVFPTRMERFYEWEDRGMVHACRDGLIEGRFQLWCIDSLDAESFYDFGKMPADRVERHLAYERYVLDEVLPFSHERSPGTSVGTVGASLGAFHAVAIAARHPTRFRRMVAFSGRFDLSRSYGPDYPDLLHGHRDASVYFLMPLHFLPNLDDSAILGALRDQEIVLVVGEDDAFRCSNEDLSGILWGRGIPHALRLWTGDAHRFRHWRHMARVYL